MLDWFSLLAAHVLISFGQTIVPFDGVNILRDALNTLGYPAVTLFIMIQGFGIPFPGGTMLLLASFYAATNNHLQIPILIACAVLGAIVGDNIGYRIGYTGGKAVIERYGHFILLKPKHLERAQRFFAKHGDKTVFFGRFIALMRPWTALLAGVNHISWRTFFISNTAGSILWVSTYGLLGYYAGRVFQNNFSLVERLAKTVSWSLAGLIILIVLIILATIFIRRRRAK